MTYWVYVVVTISMFLWEFFFDLVHQCKNKYRKASYSMNLHKLENKPSPNVGSSRTHNIFPETVGNTKSISNIKEAKDPMDHGSNPAVVVKSKVIILWVIIHR